MGNDTYQPLPLNLKLNIQHLVIMFLGYSFLSGRVLCKQKANLCKNCKKAICVIFPPPTTLSACLFIYL